MFNLLNKKQDVNLLQKYNFALDEAEKNPDIEQRLNAFNDVLKFCSKDLSCMNDNSRKRDMVLYWTYKNIGDILMEKTDKEKSSDYTGAKDNYQRALNFSRNSEEKISILQRLAMLYEKSGDTANLYNVKDLLAETYSASQKREAFENLADSVADVTRKIYFLEKALDFVKNENVATITRGKNTMRLCEKLRTIYAEKKDYANLARIEELRRNTSYLIH